MKNKRPIDERAIAAIQRVEEAIAYKDDALIAAFRFLSSEYGDDEASALEGDPLAREARPLRDMIVAALEK